MPGHWVYSRQSEPSANETVPKGLAGLAGKGSTVKRAYQLTVAGSAGVLLLTLAGAATAQNAPSQADFGRALRPIPQALQGGHQGISTLPPAARPIPTSNYSRVSTPPSVADTAVPGRSTRGIRTTTHSAPGALPGCPALSDSDDKPKIGFPVSFEFGSAQLKPEGLETLRNLGKALNQDLSDQKLFVIEGHTDAVGTLAYNEELSKLRAEAVKDFLVSEMGVTADRLEVVGKAYCDPANRRNPIGAENRRVVVVNGLH